MSTTPVSRNEFRNMFEQGIDVAAAHGNSLVPDRDLDAADADGDGLIKGTELDAVYNYLDVMDAADEGVVFGDGGLDDFGFAALKGAAAAPGQVEVMKATRDKLFDVPANEFAKSASYKPTNPEISGNWTNKFKCQLFAGDVLHEAGFDVPLERGKDSKPWVHYKHPVDWPKATDYFDKVGLDDVRPGDVVIKDYGPDGRRKDGRTGHVEIVTRVERDPETGKVVKLITAGAHPDGAAEGSKFGQNVLNARPNGDHFEQRGGDDSYYLLRPTKARPMLSAGNFPQASVIRG